jgi:hypothetical protein
MHFKKTVLCILSGLPLCSHGIVFDLNKTTPDIVTTGVQVEYDATAKQLTATGYSTNLDLPGSNSNSIYADGLRNYSLTANINENGELYKIGNSYGSFTISGYIDYDDELGRQGGASELILTGELFAFDGGLTLDEDYTTVDEAPTSSPLKYTNLLEFRFSISTDGNGDALASSGSVAQYYLDSPYYDALDYEGEPNQGAIFLNAAGANFAGEWTTDWSSGNSAASDTAITTLVTPVPESSSLALQIGGLALLGASIRRRCR